MAGRRGLRWCGSNFPYLISDRDRYGVAALLRPPLRPQGSHPREARNGSLCAGLYRCVAALDPDGRALDVRHDPRRSARSAGWRLLLRVGRISQARSGSQRTRRGDHRGVLAGTAQARINRSDARLPDQSPIVGACQNAAGSQGREAGSGQQSPQMDVVDVRLGRRKRD